MTTLPMTIIAVGVAITMVVDALAKVLPKYKEPKEDKLAPKPKRNTRS